MILPAIEVQPGTQVSAKQGEPSTAAALAGSGLENGLLDGRFEATLREATELQRTGDEAGSATEQPEAASARNVPRQPAREGFLPETAKAAGTAASAYQLQAGLQRAGLNVRATAAGSGSRSSQVVAEEVAQEVAQEASDKAASPGAASAAAFAAWKDDAVKSETAAERSAAPNGSAAAGSNTVASQGTAGAGTKRVSGRVETGKTASGRSTLAPVSSNEAVAYRPKLAVQGGSTGPAHEIRALVARAGAVWTPDAAAPVIVSQPGVSAAALPGAAESRVAEQPSVGPAAVVPARIVAADSQALPVRIVAAQPGSGSGAISEATDVLRRTGWADGARPETAPQGATGANPGTNNGANPGTNYGTAFGDVAAAGLAGGADASVATAAATSRGAAGGGGRASLSLEVSLPSGSSTRAGQAASFGLGPVNDGSAAASTDLPRENAGLAASGRDAQAPPAEAAGALQSLGGAVSYTVQRVGTAAGAEAVPAARASGSQSTLADRSTGNDGLQRQGGAHAPLAAQSSLQAVARVTSQGRAAGIAAASAQGVAQQTSAPAGKGVDQTAPPLARRGEADLAKSVSGISGNRINQNGISESLPVAGGQNASTIPSGESLAALSGPGAATGQSLNGGDGARATSHDADASHAGAGPAVPDGRSAGASGEAAGHAATAPAAVPVSAPAPAPGALPGAVPGVASATEGAMNAAHGVTVAAIRDGAAASVGAGGFQSGSSTLAQGIAAGGGTAAEPHRTLLATPTALEVGVPDGTQGWVKIRAEVGDQGQVNASLAAASSASQEMLHRQLPALNAYLHSEQMSVTATVAERGFGGLAAGGWGGGSNAATAEGGGHAGGQDASPGGGLSDNGRQPGGAASEVRSVPEYNSRTGLDADFEAGFDARAGDPPAARPGLGPESGRWLNVRA